MNKNQKGFVNILIVVLVLAGGVLAYVNMKPKAVVTPVPNEEAVACTLDAKQCPDGSYVGRVAPNCEFEKCPTEFTPESPKESNTASVNQKIFLGGGVYLTPLKVISDSRCAVDVVCIWAGEVVLKVKLEKDMTSKEVELRTGVSGVSFGPAVISLMEVSPEANSKKIILEKDYKFTFKMDWKLD